jgi:hypothetical protein
MMKEVFRRALAGVGVLGATAGVLLVTTVPAVAAPADGPSKDDPTPGVGQIQLCAHGNYPVQLTVSPAAHPDFNASKGPDFAPFTVGPVDPGKCAAQPLGTFQSNVINEDPASLNGGNVQTLISPFDVKLTGDLGGGFVQIAHAEHTSTSFAGFAQVTAEGDDALQARGNLDVFDNGEFPDKGDFKDMTQDLKPLG